MCVCVYAHVCVLYASRVFIKISPLSLLYSLFHQKVKEICNDRPGCQVEVSPNNLGFVCNDTTKYLEVEYVCGGESCLGVLA